MVSNRHNDLWLINYYLFRYLEADTFYKMATSEVEMQQCMLRYEDMDLNQYKNRRHELSYSKLDEFRK